MRIGLNSLHRPVIVMTGATSGISLATARMAAKATVVALGLLLCAARLMARSNALLARPAEISRLDIIGAKG